MKYVKQKCIGIINTIVLIMFDHEISVKLQEIEIEKSTLQNKTKKITNQLSNKFVNNITNVTETASLEQKML